jgi:hypothetical protein
MEDIAMNHEDVMRVLSDPLSDELIRTSELLRLAYTGRDGYPRVIPIGYVFNGSHFVVCTSPETPKVTALAANPHVALTIDIAIPPHVLLVRGVADIEVVPGIPDEYWQASRKGILPEQWDGFVEGVKQTYDAMARISIEPQWAKVMDFETKLPEFLERTQRERTA